MSAKKRLWFFSFQWCIFFFYKKKCCYPCCTRRVTLHYELIYYITPSLLISGCGEGQARSLLEEEERFFIRWLIIELLFVVVFFLVFLLFLIFVAASSLLPRRFLFNFFIIIIFYYVFTTTTNTLIIIINTLHFYCCGWFENNKAPSQVRRGYLVWASYKSRTSFRQRPKKNQHPAPYCQAHTHKIPIKSDRAWVTNHKQRMQRRTLKA